jgi:Fe-S-cluster containining protein
MISAAELERIRDYLGHDGFHQTIAGHHAIRMREDGACLFLDPQTTRCQIYPVRPYDCRAFPFDYISSPTTGEWVWIVWDCPFARNLTPAQLELHLCHLEQAFAATLRELRGYGDLTHSENGVYQQVLAATPATEAAPGDPWQGRPFRTLRAVRILPVIGG